MSAHKPSLGRVLSESSRIISAHSRHFLALSLLFLFPISFSTTIHNLLLQPTSLHSYHRRLLSFVSTPNSDSPPAEKSHLIIQILYIIFIIICNLCAVPPITHSAFHAFHNRSIKFTSSLKSILPSFLPLLATTLLSKIILFFILFSFGIFMLLPYTGLMLLGFNMEQNSIYFLAFVVFTAALIMGLLIYLQVEWYLMNAVVVLESEWGFAPLKRSSYLVKGARWVVFLIVLFFGILSSVLSIWYSSFTAGGVDGGRMGWVVVQIVVYAGLCALLSLYRLAADVVLFVYCKALRGELAFFEVDDEKVGRQYVPLAFDDVNAV